MLLDYRSCFATLRRFDPDKQLLERAVRWSDVHHLALHPRLCSMHTTLQPRARPALNSVYLPVLQFTDPGIWDELQQAMLADDPAPAVAALKKTCGRWWLDRKPPLPDRPAPLEFSFQVRPAAQPLGTVD